MTEYSVIEYRAAQFARQKHRGVARKYSIHRPIPFYIVHPAAVADIVRSVQPNGEMLAAAWLHDVVEDCGVTIDEIRSEFTPRVAELVDSLTDVTKKEDGNRAVRVAMNREHSLKGDAESQTIKMADIINNSYRIWDLAPKFAPVYWEEKRLLVNGLTKADQRLRDFQLAMTGRETDDMRYENATAPTLFMLID